MLEKLIFECIPLQKDLYSSIISSPLFTSSPELLGVLKSRSYLLSAAQKGPHHVKIIRQIHHHPCLRWMVPLDGLCLSNWKYTALYMITLSCLYSFIYINCLWILLPQCHGQKLGPTYVLLWPDNVIEHNYLNNSKTKGKDALTSEKFTSSNIHTNLHFPCVPSLFNGFFHEVQTLLITATQQLIVRSHYKDWKEEWDTSIWEQ